jgi:hypothetical protein
MDVRYPNPKNSLRVDSRSSLSIIGLSTRNKRHLYTEANERKIYDKVKQMAVEGSLLTLIGKV